MLFQIPIKRMHPAAMMPQYAHGLGIDNGVDLFACERVVIRPGATSVVGSGWAFGLPAGYGFFVLPRSGTSKKTDVRIANAPGLIDQSFTGEVGILVWNKGEDEIIIHPGDRVAQGVLLETPGMMFFEVQELPSTARGANGFGSTGR